MSRKKRTSESTTPCEECKFHKVKRDNMIIEGGYMMYFPEACGVKKTERIEFKGESIKSCKDWQEKKDK